MYRFIWATFDQKPEDAFVLRKKVFMEEQGFAYDTDETDQIAYHLTMYCGNHAVGTGRIFKEKEGENTYHFGRICIEKGSRGKGLGSFLMNEMERKAKQLGATSVIISSQFAAVPFYESLGYHKQGEVYLEEKRKHQLMVKDLYIPSNNNLE